ncbi:hypothetical protein J31TS4_09440 [Paenibacillus sp. J31TS4]|uniref:hypothetical protein n=1 Tax=Paenibacillus sp. J31TS4 TaxID=2807195 RepID=UPI001B06CFDB|nr:hypothetical protein [Paenibacillus sp. J31TS4]GIP37664.1 hypothetical protein J31TS4_09440 [Paenibacillus sp. J31TS4]
MGRRQNDPVDPVIRMKNVILGWGLVIGIVLGCIVGMLADNLTIGLLVFVPLGSLAGSFLGSWKSRSMKQE